MTERITPADVVKVAGLARLRLTDDDEPMARPIHLVNVFRADVPMPPLDRDDVLGAAPVAEQGQFRVPTILGEAP